MRRSVASVDGADEFAVWPTLRDDAVRRAELAAVLADLGDLAPGRRDDIIWAWAAMAGDPRAIAVFETLALAPAVARARRRMRDLDVDELAQRARVALLTADDDQVPRLASYRGRGPLPAFVATVVVRLAIDATRRGPREVHSPLAELFADPHPDAELELMRRRYATELAAAAARAWPRLPAHERFVLGLELHERLDVDAIARAYGVQRGTALRKLVAARTTMVELIRDELRAALQVGADTVDSVLRVVSTSARWAAVPELPTQ